MKQRIDQWLVEQGHFTSREQAQRAVMAGEVRLDGKPVVKPSQPVPDVHRDQPIQVTIVGTGQPYVSRGGLKLEKALRTFAVSVAGKICLDAGASTGGFTDCLLQSGAVKVYAIYVGYGQLAWKLRQDSRVIPWERENIRYFEVRHLDSLPELITADLSFISLELVFPKFQEMLAPGGDVITLIKPQFEAGRDKVGKKGVVRDRAIHLEILKRLANRLPQSGWQLVNLTFSPIRGPEGNIEYLGHWRRMNHGIEITPQSGEMIETVVTSAWKELDHSQGES